MPGLNISAREVTIFLPGLTLPLLVPRNVEDLITDPADEDNIPLWAEIWPAARGLARYIWENVPFSGETVLELGAGTGLPGLVCGLKGARVTFSDYKPEALQFCKANAALQKVKEAYYLLADWRDFTTDRQFDWIIGSDILYDPKFYPFLAEIFTRCLKPGGQLLISHPGRPATFDFLEKRLPEYFHLLAVKTIPVTIEEPYFLHHDIFIHHYLRAGKLDPCPPAGK
ncbi:Predicted nicotinamide N-methyase [Desulfofundulus australicus DSM 11792]|uniref:Predicted nicotinamide N-methyase n=1 Tax=Desulfofundulus australicus DSM 11792 TaxID=1121425 RepID=A0A1M5B7Y4_9FIRM|nr:methyltransferase domain-containing protein [Desulfofundulus australicus]SHF38661.1 Predicted nicotinamide N-methyase [Desulfofundulus australicus DSM 11792]